MKKELFTEIEIPEGIEIKLEENNITIKGPEGENSRTFKIGRLDFNIKDNKIILGNKFSTKTEKKIMNTLVAHIKNMIKGVQEKFEYQLKICFSHFPFTIKQEGNKIIVKNFLGEKVDRIVEMPKGAEIEIKKDIITIKSIDKEIAGQASANLEAITKIKRRDKRIFQDGIYITNKCGREM
ncbi:MAG: 50S ribosomal protein L6 [Nanoarchaeota archaeon]|nr:50S ribosomal protein L6 [Nanoarchaeota archaeon]